MGVGFDGYEAWAFHSLHGALLGTEVKLRRGVDDYNEDAAFICFQVANFGGRD
jgi:hypothetical protein